MPQSGRSLSHVPPVLARTHRSGADVRRSREVGTFCPTLEHVAADGYGSGRVRGGAGSRASRRPRTGERAGAAARGRARQPRAHPRRRAGSRRRPPDDDGRDRRRGRRRTLDALPPLRDPRGSVRRARRRGRTQADAAPEPQPSGRLAPLPYQAPGRLGRAQPLALEVTHVLDEVPPHLIADQLVAEARRAAGVAVALYIVDIDGSQLIRLAGSEDFPETLEAPPALGPRSCPRGCRRSTSCSGAACRAASPTPLWLRGRVIGLLLCVGAPVAPLEDIAKQGAAALELANDYTDVIEAARRRKPTTAAAEVQYHLLPPRVARVTGAQIAGALLPAYEVGGDWFDFVENRDGSWLAIADTAGTGPTAAGLGASALGALRAARRSGQDLVQAAESIDEVVRALGNPSFVVTALLARWHAPTAMLAWINCGHPPAYVVDRRGRLHRARGPGPRGARRRRRAAELRGRRGQPRARGPARPLHRRGHRALRQGRRPVRRRRDAAGDPGRRARPRPRPPRWPSSMPS